MRKQNLPIQRLLTARLARRPWRDELRYPDISALYAAVGEGHVSAQRVVQRLVAVARRRGGRDRGPRRGHHPGRAPGAAPRSGDPGVVVKGVDDVWVKLARCCTPVPGDPIIGFVTRGSGVSVHRTDCVNVDVAAAPSPSASSRSSGRPPRPRVFLVQHPGRGARPLPAAVRRHPGAVRPARQHPVGRRCRPRATGWPSRGSPSRWATPSTSATC